jgi:hypothetical protein
VDGRWESDRQIVPKNPVKAGGGKGPAGDAPGIKKFVQTGAGQNEN